MHGSGGGFSVAVEKRPFSRRAILLGVTVPRGDSFSAMHLRCAAEPRHRLTCTAGICGDTVPDHLTLLSHRSIRVALPLITQCELRGSRTLHPRNGLTPPVFRCRGGDPIDPARAKQAASYSEKAGSVRLADATTSFLFGVI